MGTTVSGTLAANGSTPAHSVDANLEVSSGAFLHLQGTFGGGTAQVEFFAADSTWRDYAGLSFTADVTQKIEIPNSMLVRVTLSGATTPSIYYQLSSMSLARN